MNMQKVAKKEDYLKVLDFIALIIIGFVVGFAVIVLSIISVVIPYQMYLQEFGVLTSVIGASIPPIFVSAFLYLMWRGKK